MKRLLIAFVSMMFVIAGYAQMSQEEIVKSYIADIDESVALMKGPSEAWNQGEAFSSFIEKFSTDEAFMNSRISLTGTQKSEYKDLLVPSNFEAKHPFAKEGGEDAEMFYQMWGEMQWGTVHLDCGWVDSYYAHTFEFKRIDGKWHLVKIVPGE